MSAALDEQECIPCKNGTPPLKGKELYELAARINTGWEVIDQLHLQQEFKFKNFREALVFTNMVGELAEKEGHHPDIELGWGRCLIRIWTHKINGLSVNDFILAAKIDNLN